MKPVSIAQNTFRLPTANNAQEKPEQVNSSAPGVFASSIAEVGNEDKDLRTLTHSFQVSADMQKVFSRLLANNS